MDNLEPKRVYDERLAERRSALARLEGIDRAIANGRLAVMALAGGVAYLAFGPELLSQGWLVAAALVFAGLAVAHDRVIREKGRVALAARFYERGIDRLLGRWQSGATGESYLDAAHPYAADLDVFGPGSLYTLLATVQTPAGEEILARWLSAPATAEDVSARQAAVLELRPKLELREALFAIGGDVRLGFRPDELVRWGEAPSLLTRGMARAVGLVSAGTLAAAISWPLGAGFGPLLAAAVVVVLPATRLLRSRVERVLGLAERASRELTVLAKLLARLEREPASAPCLGALRASLRGSGVPASRRIGRLARLIEMADARRNQLFAPIAYLLLWGPLWAAAVERWRRRHGAALRRWLASVGELEALAALAAYAFEHPGDVFPEITSGGPLFEAEGLAHPFLAEAEAVRNDLTIGAPGPRLLVVSGSNMSGKSTLLRSVGVAAVMALAGAPVRARRLRLSALVLGASLRVGDSLHAHTSRFYAEVKRLEQLVRLTDARAPVLFLIDEILHGTNSHDRREGARAILTTLVARGAVGLVTTHDLALTGVADELGPAAANVHFVDHLEDSRLVFDYRVRPGVVTKSNAIALMRAVGLPV